MMSTWRWVGTGLRLGSAERHWERESWCGEAGTAGALQRKELSPWAACRCWREKGCPTPHRTGLRDAAVDAVISVCPTPLLFLLFLLVLQFGFITIFVAACPLAPLFDLLNHCVEICLDRKSVV